MGSRTIEDINWLAHRWPIALETSGYGNWTLHTARIDGQRVGQASSREDFDRRAHHICNVTRFVMSLAKISRTTTLCQRAV